ncbi:MAG: copper resistance system multicopper oxidase [Acidobacteria bacterium]|nr:copper resistance system multicopper oxidase [Acidobacteriota bacterium]
MSPKIPRLDRRTFLNSVGAGAAWCAASALLPPWALVNAGHRRLAPATGALDTDIDLAIRRTALDIDGRRTSAVTIDGSVPGPLLRFREGGTATLRVHNELDEPTSVHWHGILLPPEMDGVPGISFGGIPPGETFEYHYRVVQNGTYWYHSHSGLQEQLGHFGPLIIDPAQGDPFDYDREHTVMLSDWTFENPYKILGRLKKRANYYNYQRRTVGDLFSDAGEQGLGAALADRAMWGRMRMDVTDLADITGATYRYLVNGMAAGDNWTGLFEPGERVRLRLINASAASFFDVRIPGLALTVVQADGQNVEPVTVDELRIATAETYDVIVHPREERAYTLFAESIDRSGYARGTLAPRLGMQAEVPELRPRPLRTMADMGMDHADMNHVAMGPEPSADAMDHAAMGHGDLTDQPMTMTSELPTSAPHGPDHHGPGSAGVAEAPTTRLGEPGIGLGNDGWRVLVYSDLRALEPLYEHRTPDREIELHATGNMERYMWSFDGKKFTQVEGPITFFHGERLRINFVNDTMMEHPLHLHGMWIHLVNGNGAHNPRKHTVNLKPGERMFVDVEVDAPGRWAFHCHILYHMDAGMFRVVDVVDASPAHEHSDHQDSHSLEGAS